MYINYSSTLSRMGDNVRIKLDSLIIPKAKHKKIILEEVINIATFRNYEVVLKCFDTTSFFYITDGHPHFSTPHTDKQILLLKKYIKNDIAGIEIRLICNFVMYTRV